MSPELSIIENDWKTGFVKVSMQYQSILFAKNLPLQNVGQGNLLRKTLSILKSSFMTSIVYSILLDDPTIILKVKFLCIATFVKFMQTFILYDFFPVLSVNRVLSGYLSICLALNGLFQKSARAHTWT